MTDIALKILSPFFALAALTSSIQLTNSLRFGQFRWWIELRTREEMPVRYWLVIIGNTVVLCTALFLLGEAFLW